MLSLIIGAILIYRNCQNFSDVLKEALENQAENALRTHCGFDTGDVHFFASFTWQGKKVLLKSRSNVKRKYPNEKIDSHSIFREYEIMSKVQNFSSDIVPKIFGSIAKPPSYILEDLRPHGYRLLSDNTICAVRVSRYLGKSLKALHDKLSLININEVSRSHFKAENPAIYNQQCCRNWGKQLIHGDINSDNILVYKNQIRFIDFENTSYGCCASDVGWCLGHLILKCNQVTVAKRAASQFLRSYKLNFTTSEIRHVRSSLFSCLKYRRNMPKDKSCSYKRIWSNTEVNQILNI